MGIAFSSSLLGLAGSLVVGFLELMTAGAQNRFYGELETWMSTMTKISSTDGDSGGFGQDLAEQLAFVSQQMTARNRIIAEGEDRRAADSSRIAEAMAGGERIAAQAVAERETISQAVAAQSRMLAAVERLADTSMGAGGDGLAAETRRHIRNIDILLAKIIEETANGRGETAESLRRELRAVGRAVSDMSAAVTGARTPS